MESLLPGEGSIQGRKQLRVEMFGGLRLLDSREVITHFRTRYTGGLLAMLAYNQGQGLAREQLIDSLWPETDWDHGRANLNTAISWLRRVLEPPGTTYSSVLDSDRLMVRLRPGSVTTDVGEFVRRIQAARTCADRSRRIQLLTPAFEQHRARILPGYGEAWIPPAQAHLNTLYHGAVLRLARDMASSGDPQEALHVISRALTIDPQDLDLHRLALSTLIQGGQISRARRQGEFLLQMLQEAGLSPTSADCELLATARACFRGSGAGSSTGSATGAWKEPWLKQRRGGAPDHFAV